MEIDLSRHVNIDAMSKQCVVCKYDVGSTDGNEFLQCLEQHYVTHRQDLKDFVRRKVSDALFASLTLDGDAIELLSRIPLDTQQMFSSY